MTQRNDGGLLAARGGEPCPDCAAPVAQGPVAYLIRGEQQHDQFRMDLAQAKACKGLRDTNFDGEDKTAIIPLYAAPAPIAAQAQPWQALAAAMYQAAGAYDMPVRILDALSAAANGEPFAHLIDGLLPVECPEASAQHREDAEHCHAIKEAERNAACDSYFKARDGLLGTIDPRTLFESGFDRGYDAARAAKEDRQDE